jgi:hypothetical protein
MARDFTSNSYQLDFSSEHEYAMYDSGARALEAQKVAKFVSERLYGLVPTYHWLLLKNPT